MDRSISTGDQSLDLLLVTAKKSLENVHFLAAVVLVGGQRELLEKIARGRFQRCVHRRQFTVHLVLVDRRRLAAALAAHRRARRMQVLLLRFLRVDAGQIHRGTRRRRRSRCRPFRVQFRRHEHRHGHMATLDIRRENARVVTAFGRSRETTECRWISQSNDAHLFRSVPDAFESRGSKWVGNGGFARDMVLFTDEVDADDCSG